MSSIFSGPMITWWDFIMCIKVFAFVPNRGLIKRIWVNCYWLELSLIWLLRRHLSWYQIMTSLLSPTFICTWHGLAWSGLGGGSNLTSWCKLRRQSHPGYITVMWLYSYVTFLGIIWSILASSHSLHRQAIIWRNVDTLLHGNNWCNVMWCWLTA